jgi:ABC-type transporter Mla MlaB component
MLRTTEERTSDNTMTFRLEGGIVGPWVALLEASSEEILRGACKLTIDLGEVVFADQEGIALLARLQQRQVAFSHCSPFLQAQLKPVSTGKLTMSVEPRRA